MTAEKLWTVLAFYDQELDYCKVEARQMSEQAYAEPFTERTNLLSHCRWMIQKCLRVFKPEFEAAWTTETRRYGWEMSPDMAARIEKAREPLEKSMRWLGYIQGILQAHGVYSCNELREHSRSEPKEDKDGNADRPGD